jgi:4-hydroxyphenylpyruvate dioxygenase
MEIDRVRFYVADALQLRDWSIDKLGLTALEDRSNPLTMTYLVGNDYLRFELSSPLDPASPVADYLQSHPPGVQDIGFRVQDLERLRQKIDRLGVQILAESSTTDRSQWLTIQGWGSLEHTIVQAELTRTNRQTPATTAAIIGIDHLVLNVAAGELDAASIWYENLFDFQVQQTFQIHTDRSGLASKALISRQGEIKFNINEPTSASSQIQEFLDLNRGAGIQHIALETNNILQTVDRMQQQGLEFLPVPAAYYTQLKHRARCDDMRSLAEPEWHTLERLQILVDWQPEQPQALLMQTFTQPIFTEPTFFFEAIERRDRAVGFGQGNFQALFEAIEQNRELKVES